VTYEEIRALYERLDRKYHPTRDDDLAQIETLRQIRYSLERIAAEAAERGNLRWSIRLSTLDSLLRMSEDFDAEHRYDLAILAMVVALVYAWILSEEALTENAINLQARNTDGR
jgi:hypothetical protein